MTRPHKVVLKERKLQTGGQAHALLARELDLPSHYGANLDALADCLSEIDKPTRIVLKRDPDARKPWFDALERVVREEAQRSCYLGCSVVRTPRENPARH